MPQKLHVFQDGDSFRVTSEDKKTIIYLVEKKRASTVLDLKFRDNNNVYVGGLREDELIRFQYHIFSQADDEIGRITLKKKGVIENILSIQYRGEVFLIRDFTRGRNIEVKDEDGNNYMTIDKKILRRKDSYTLKIYSTIDSFLAVVLTLIIDDIYFNN